MPRSCEIDHLLGFDVWAVEVLCFAFRKQPAVLFAGRRREALHTTLKQHLATNLNRKLTTLHNINRNPTQREEFPSPGRVLLHVRTAAA